MYASPQEEILDLVEWGDFNSFDVADLIREWANCHQANVQTDGNVEIRQPQAPHFLSSAKLLEFLNWNCARHAQHLLIGCTLRFAEACDNFEEIDEAIEGMADLSDCKQWDITPSEWRQALHCAQHTLSQEGGSDQWDHACIRPMGWG